MISMFFIGVFVTLFIEMAIIIIYACTKFRKGDK